MATSFRHRRSPLEHNPQVFGNRRVTWWLGLDRFIVCAALLTFVATPIARGQMSAPMQGPVKITLDDAIQLALKHNHALLAAQTTILQSQALEEQANLRPNPTLFSDWEYLPLGSPSTQNSRLYPPGEPLSQYLHDNTEADMGLSYLFERGKKRQHRLQAAQDITAQTRSLVADNERTLTFNIASQFIFVQLAESTLELAEKDVKSFQQTTDISEITYKAGGMSEDDFLKIELQLLQYQTDYEQAMMAKDQSLDDLRNLIGYESVPADYDVAGPFDYQPVKGNLEDLQMKALQNRPDLRAAQQGIKAATSQWELQKADGKVDVTGQANYSHVNGINAATFYVSVPLPIFNRNQGNIAQAHYAITQSEELAKGTTDQVMTDVHDAYMGLQENDRIIVFYKSKYLDVAEKDREISLFAYQHGAASLLDYLDAERTYRATQLAYRQALASYLTALEQLREAVGSRTLP
jgi:outer membrane protein, heavy metal efflux system